MNLPVWMYWVGECPAWIKACMATVFAHAPDVRLLTPAEFDAMWDVDRGDIDVTRLLYVSHRSDFIRSFLLARHGGLWIDADCVVLRPLQPILDLLPEHDFLGYFEEQDHIATNFIGAQPGSRIAAAYYQRNCDILRSRQHLGWLSLTSFALTDAIAAVGIPWKRLDQDLVQPISWSKPEEFFTIQNKEGHAHVFNDRSFCYMLANTIVRQVQEARSTPDLMDPDTFFSYLLDRASDDSQQIRTPTSPSPLATKHGSIPSKRYTR